MASARNSCDIEAQPRSDHDEEKSLSEQRREDVGSDGEIERIATADSRASKRSKLSNVFSRASKSSKKKETLITTTIPLSDLSRGIIGWENQEDPAMPLNFTHTRKWVIVVSLAVITFMSPLSSSILAPAIEAISKEFHNDNITLGAFPVSIYLLGYAVGPLFLGPLSEIHGRAIVLTAANTFFCLWHIGTALAPSLNSLIFFRFMSGVGGSGCLSLGGAVIGDLFPVVGRGKALSIWTLGALIGPSLGPLIGAFIAGSIGWRWNPWIVLIPSSIVSLILGIFLPETNHRVLIDHKVRRVKKELERNDLVSCYQTPETANLSPATRLKMGLLRPLKMLIFAPILSALSIYVSFIYGTIYLLYNTISTTFEDQYGFTTGLTGLVYVALGVGYIIGLCIFSTFSDATVVRLTQANGGVAEPEMRLNLILWFAAVTPMTYFWYGWTAQYQVHWIVPILGLIPVGIGIIGVYMQTQAYIVDACPAYAASGLAAFTVLRSAIAAFLPLAGPALFRNLGLGWGSSLLGFICIALTPLPLLVYKYGTKLRKKYPLDL